MSKKEKVKTPREAAEAAELEIAPLATSTPPAHQAPALALATPALASDITADAFRILVEGAPRVLTRRIRIF